MVFLLFECRIPATETICLNDEFCEYAWVEPVRLSSYDLNSATRETFQFLGLMEISLAATPDALLNKPFLLKAVKLRKRSETAVPGPRSLIIFTASFRLEDLLIVSLLLNKLQRQ
jgi:hypothetical protein